MIVVLAIDALEFNLVEKFDCVHLKQRFYGKTDISEFSEPRTMVLWTSFMTGKNTEKEILSKGDRGMWNAKLEINDTFFKHFIDPKVIDLPGFSYDLEQHKTERDMLRLYFESDAEDEKMKIRAEYNDLAFEHHKKIKNEFSDGLEEDHDLIIGYFSIADVVGHLNFGNRILMKMIYKDLDEIASSINEDFMVISDHGMMEIGIFGDHSNYGFWSNNREEWIRPKITDFAKIILNFRRP